MVRFSPGDFILPPLQSGLLHSGKLTCLAGKNGSFEDVFSIKRLFFHRHVSLPSRELTYPTFKKKENHLQKCLAKRICFGCGPLPVTVTTRIITFSVGDPYEPSFTTGILGGGHTQDMLVPWRVLEDLYN